MSQNRGGEHSNASLVPTHPTSQPNEGYEHRSIPTAEHLAGQSIAAVTTHGASPAHVEPSSSTGHDPSSTTPVPEATQTMQTAVTSTETTLLATDQRPVTSTAVISSGPGGPSSQSANIALTPVPQSTGPRSGGESGSVAPTTSNMVHASTTPPPPGNTRRSLTPPSTYPSDGVAPHPISAVTTPAESSHNTQPRIPVRAVTVPRSSARSHQADSYFSNGHGPVSTSQPTSPQPTGGPSRRQTGTSLPDDGETLSGQGSPRTSGVQRFSTIHNPLPPLPQERDIEARHAIPGATTVSRTGLDWIVPINDKPGREKTLFERLDPTLKTAREEKVKYELRARWTGWALNIAIGLQVVLGALTTGLSAALSGHQVSIVTSVLGGLSTIVASYLARARGSGEPELSNARVKDLDQFIRECEAFQMDYGHVTGDPKFDAQLDALRHRFEEMLGNYNAGQNHTQSLKTSILV